MAGEVAWELATRPLPAALRAHVRRLQGYDERSPVAVRRPELPGTSVVVILELGPPIAVQPLGQTEGLRARGGFVAGLDERPALTTHDGWQRGVQLDLPATRARQLFGTSMDALHGQVLPLTELLRADDRALPEQLDDLAGWDARLDRVERWLLLRLAAGPRPDRRVAWAVQEIERRGGNLDVIGLRRTLGLSGKHLVALFREHVGLPPKRYARLVRFERLVARVRRGPPRPWAELAVELGFCDQAHLARDVRALCGMTPTGLAALVGAAPMVWAEAEAHAG
jgi:AraC-like DNA-binding protein